MEAYNFALPSHLNKLLIMYRFLVFFTFVLLLGCKNEPESTLSTPLAEAKNNLENNPGEEAALEYLNLLRDEMHKDLYHPRVEDYLREGIEVADNNNLETYKIGYTTSLLQAYPDIEDREHFLGLLAETFGKRGKSLPGDILIQGYLEKYPNGERAAVIKSYQSSPIEDPFYLLDSIATKIFEGNDARNINQQAARQFVDGTEATSLAYPEHEAIPDYLFKAAEIARSTGGYQKAMELYDWIYRGYKDSDFGPKALISQALMLESDLQDFNGAKEKYDIFIKTYPDDELIDQVKALRENVGLTNEQLMEKFKAQRQGQE